MSNLKTLRERVEAASGPDRALDAAIWYALVERPASPFTHDRDMVGRWPTYTASTDAALALVERGLPEWRWSLQKLHDGTHNCELEFVEESDDVWTDVVFGGYAPTPPLTILSALLSALEAKEMGE